MYKALGLALFALTLTVSSPSFAKGKNQNIQVGIGAGTVSQYPVGSFPYALMGAIEGTYRYNSLGLAVVAAAVSSPQVNGQYWFGANGSYKQTMLEPRLYFGPLHFGLAVALALADGTDEVTSVGSYAPMAGLEFPMGPFSLGVDARYFFNFSGKHPTPLQTLLMFRFKI